MAPRAHQHHCRDLAGWAQGEAGVLAADLAPRARAASAAGADAPAECGVSVDDPLCSLPVEIEREFEAAQLDLWGEGSHFRGKIVAAVSTAPAPGSTNLWEWYVWIVPT